MPITSNDHRNKWHPDLLSAAVGFIVAIIAGILIVCIDVKISDTGANKLQQLLHRECSKNLPILNLRSNTPQSPSRDSRVPPKPNIHRSFIQGIGPSVGITDTWGWSYVLALIMYLMGQSNTSDAHGFIAIEHPEQYGLPAGKQSGPYTQNFGVSMYHQMHCLARCLLTFFISSPLITFFCTR